ncbi:MAG: Calx-beta domain-containing protein [Candidatus Ornithomonoglobus sp.]
MYTVIEFSDAEYYPEDGYIKATVIRSGCMTNVVEVTLDTSDDTADGGRDYSEVHSEVTFPFGIEKRTINIPVRSQYLTDTARFKLTLSAPQGCVLGERAESFGIISPEDEGFAVQSDETEMSVAASTDGIYLDSAIGWPNPSSYTGGTGSSSSYSKEVNGNWVMYSGDGTFVGAIGSVASQCTTFMMSFRLTEQRCMPIGVKPEYI